MNAPLSNDPKDMTLTIKSRYGTVNFETDRDNDLMIEMEEREGTPASYLNVKEATQLRDFITSWLEALAALENVNGR